MRSQFILFFALVLLALSFAACGGGNTPPNSNSGANSAPANSAKANSKNPLETTKAPSEQTVNDAPTLSPVFKAYCAAMRNKDEAAVRKIYSQSTLKLFETQMKADKVPNLLKFLENDKIDKICEIRNEQITGDKAVAEIKADWCPNGAKVVFVKEDGEWKLTNISPDIDNMKSSANADSKK